MFISDSALKPRQYYKPEVYNDPEIYVKLTHQDRKDNSSSLQIPKHLRNPNKL